VVLPVVVDVPDDEASRPSGPENAVEKGVLDVRSCRKWICSEKQRE
jgi:hypothetical protein